MKIIILLKFSFLTPKGLNTKNLSTKIFVQLFYRWKYFLIETSIELKIEFFRKNRNGGVTLKFRSKIKLLAKFHQKSNLHQKIAIIELDISHINQNENLSQQWKIWPKNKILTKNENFEQNEVLFTKNRNVGLKWKIWSKIEI